MLVRSGTPSGTLPMLAAGRLQWALRAGWSRSYLRKDFYVKPQPPWRLVSFIAYGAARTILKI